MDFTTYIQQYPVEKVTDVLGCGWRVVYAWRQGERQPREWIQRLIVAELERAKALTSDSAAVENNEPSQRSTTGKRVTSKSKRGQRFVGTSA